MVGNVPSEVLVYQFFAFSWCKKGVFIWMAAGKEEAGCGYPDL